MRRASRLWSAMLCTPFGPSQQTKNSNRSGRFRVEHIKKFLRRMNRCRVAKKSHVEPPARPRRILFAGRALQTHHTENHASYIVAVMMGVPMTWRGRVIVGGRCRSISILLGPDGIERC